MPKKPKKKRNIAVLDVGFGIDYTIRFDPSMGYTFDTKVKIPAAANTTTNANPATGTISIAADADLLIVSMIWGGNSPRAGGAPTANGRPLLVYPNIAAGVTEALAEQFYLFNPDVGTNVIVVPNEGTAKNLDIFVSSYKPGAGYYSSTGTTAFAGTTSANPSVSLNNISTVNNVVIGTVGHGANSWNPSSQSGTVLYNEDPATWGGGAQYILNSPTGTVICAWTQGSDDYGLVAAAFLAWPSAPTNQTGTVSDIGSGSDQISQLLISLIQSDTGQGSDQQTVLQTRQINETGNGLDSVTVFKLISINDTGNGSDNVSISVSLGVDDTAQAVYRLGDFPVTSILDDFNRPNQGPPLGINWTVVPVDPGDWGKVVDQHAYATDVEPGNQYWNVQKFNAIEIYLYLFDFSEFGEYPEIFWGSDESDWIHTGYTLFLYFVSGIWYIEVSQNNPFVDLIPYQEFSIPNPSNPFWIGIRHESSGNISIFYKQNNDWILYAELNAPLEYGWAWLEWTGSFDDFGGGDIPYMDIPTVSAYVPVNDLELNIDEIISSKSVSINDNGTISESLQIMAAAGNRYWVGGTGNWSDAANHWSSESSGTPNSVYLPNSNCDVFIDINSGFGAGGNITLTSTAMMKSFISDVGNPYTITGSVSYGMDIYGSITLEAGLSVAISWMDFYGGSSGLALNFADLPLDVRFMDFYGTGTWSLQSNLFLAGAGVFNNLYIENGTFDANDFNITCQNVDFYSDVGKSPIVYMGSGTWQLSENFTVSEKNAIQITLYAETSLVHFTGDQVFIHGGKTFYDIECDIGLDFFFGSFYIGDTVTFHNVVLHDPATVGSGNYYFSSGKTYVFTGDFIALGNTTRNIQLNADATGQYTFYKTSGIVACDYLDISYSNATGGAAWYAGSHSLDSLDNDGWIFSDFITTLPENGSGSDAISNISVLLSLFDTGLGTDEISVLAQLLKAISDVGYGLDNLSIQAQLALDENGDSSDALSIQAQFSLGDTGFGVDEPTLAALLGISDSGSGNDVFLTLSALLSLIETAYGIDLTTISANLSVSENGIGLEAFTISVSLSVDETGLGTDAISVLTAAIVLVQDLASAVDGLSIQAQLSTTETASGTDAFALQIQFILPETSTGIDTPEVAASMGITDGALGGDFLDLFAGLNVAEIGTGFDTLSDLLASLSLAESGTADDLLQLMASLSVGDIGLGSDSINIITGILRIIADAGLGSDQVNISVSLSTQDTGTGTDALAIQVSLQINDTGLGTDNISVLITVLRQINDLAFGIDGIDIAASLNIGENSYGIDDPAIQALLGLIENGAGSDTPNISASLTVTDISSAADIISIIQAMLVLISDTGAGSDAITSITASIPVDESGLGSDQIGQILASLLVTDLGTGVDIVIKYDSTSNILTIEFILNKPRITSSLSQPTTWIDLDVPKIDIKLKTNLQ